MLDIGITLRAPSSNKARAVPTQKTPNFNGFRLSHITFLLQLSEHNTLFVTLFTCAAAAVFALPAQPSEKRTHFSQHQKEEIKKPPGRATRHKRILWILFSERSAQTKCTALAMAKCERSS